MLSNSEVRCLIYSFGFQERYVNLKARVKELREENRRLNRKLHEEAEISFQLKEENNILLVYPLKAFYFAQKC